MEIQSSVKLKHRILPQNILTLSMNFLNHPLIESSGKRILPPNLINLSIDGLYNIPFKKGDLPD